MLTQQLLLQLAVILAVVQVCGYLAGLIGQQWVIGEIVAGIVLGPTLFGTLFPGLSHQIFPPSVQPTLQALGDVGLVLYMFTVGVRLDAERIFAQRRRAIIISASGIIVPLALGAGLGYLLYTTPGYVGTHAANQGTFMLLVGTAMAITAFPVLARILFDKGMAGTALGTLALACASIDDITAWCLLALVMALVHAVEAATVGLLVLEIVVFIGVMLTLVRPLLSLIDRHLTSAHLRVAVLMTLLWLAAELTTGIGIHPVFGAFLMGVIVPRTTVTLEYVRSIDRVNSVTFLPLFFILSGLRTQIWLLNAPHLWLVCLAILTVAIVGKLVGGAVAMWATGADWRESLALGVLMNTRGLVELIVLNIGLSAGVLSLRLFSMLVIMALITTMMTSPLLPLLGYRNMRDREAAAAIQAHLA